MLNACNGYSSGLGSACRDFLCTNTSSIGSITTAVFFMSGLIPNDSLKEVWGYDQNFLEGGTSYLPPIWV